MSFSIPNLNDFVQWFKSRILPEDPEIGAGISDWTITAEYVPNLEVGGTKAFGALCSPSDTSLMITPEDVAAKRAHFLICTPENERDIQEMYETFRHECEHILQSMYAKLGESTRAAMENHAHSMGNFIARLTPEEILLFPRWKLTPMARAYRAKDKAMPDPIKENKDKPPKDAPAMQEGAPRDVAAIMAEMAMIDAKDPSNAQKLLALNDELQKALIKAGIEAQGSNGPASTPEPPMAPPTMGMKPEDAYARAKRESDKQAAEALAKSIPGLDDKQRAYLRAKCNNIADVEAALEIMPRTTSQNEPARMGMQTNPKTDPAGKQSPFARMRKGPSDPMVREAIGLPSTDPNEHGIGTAPAHILTFSFAENARNFQDKYRAKMRAQREAAS